MFGPVSPSAIRAGCQVLKTGNACPERFSPTIWLLTAGVTAQGHYFWKGMMKTGVNDKVRIICMPVVLIAYKNTCLNDDFKKVFDKIYTTLTNSPALGVTIQVNLRGCCGGPAGLYAVWRYDDEAEYNKINDDFKVFEHGGIVHNIGQAFPRRRFCFHCMSDSSESEPIYCS